MKFSGRNISSISFIVSIIIPLSLFLYFSFIKLLYPVYVGSNEYPGNEVAGFAFFASIIILFVGFWIAVIIHAILVLVSIKIAFFIASFLGIKDGQLKTISDFNNSQYKYNEYIANYGWKEDTLTTIILAIFYIGGFIYLYKPFECIPFAKTSDHVGEYRCVVGRVDNVYTSSIYDGGHSYLNFCADYKTCPISVIIFENDTYKITNLEQYENKVIEINGFIASYQGRAQIQLHNSDQIKIQ